MVWWISLHTYPSTEWSAKQIVVQLPPAASCTFIIIFVVFSRAPKCVFYHFRNGLPFCGAMVVLLLSGLVCWQKKFVYVLKKI
jgi:hypothetical protein